MNFSNSLRLVLAVAFLMASGMAIAQDSNNDQADVWATIEGQWEAEEQGDKDWMEELLAEKFSGWGKNSPAPRSKASAIMWDRFNDEQGEMVAHELYPLAIVVEGDVAIAHYLYSSAYESKNDETEMNNGRYTDVLVRTDDGWKFIAWHGGDDD
ncbi:MAG: nuclear transport factor 2 family protein [Gammaproteobacteria bacterium]|nr:nuclear transport factor 2 family protein [Gammaproteobacteria bacterium]